MATKTRTIEDVYKETMGVVVNVQVQIHTGSEGMPHYNLAIGNVEGITDKQRCAFYKKNVGMSNVSEPAYLLEELHKQLDLVVRRYYLYKKD